MHIIQGMKYYLFILIVLLFLAAGCTSAGAPQNETQAGTVEKTEPAGSGNEAGEKAVDTDDAVFAGTWQGYLEAGAVKLRTVFNIDFDGSAYVATIDSPDQGAFGLAVSKVEAEGKHIRLVSDMVAGEFSGDLDGPGLLRGIWSQAGQKFPLELTLLAEKPVYGRSQDPQEPYPYESVEVEFLNAGTGIKLAGTLTLPRTDGDFPLVILVSGSGPQNRNEEVMGHRPFLVLSDFLTRAGIGVLRYDDRGVGRSEGDYVSATTFDFAGDVRAALDYIRSRGDLDIGGIGLIGHSEGALIAPMVAADTPGVDFIVMLAGPGVTGEEILIQQTEAILKASGMNDLVVDQATAANRSIYTIIKENPDVAAAERKLRAYLPGLGMTAETIDAQVAELLSPWFRTFLEIDPQPYLEKVSVPVLALNGSLDLQVPADENLAAIETALKQGGNTAYRLVKIEGLNHLFQPAVTGLVEEYSTIEETMSPAALKIIIDWINAL